MINQEEALDGDQLDEIFRIAKLVGKYQQGVLSRKESGQLQQWLDKSPANLEKFNALVKGGHFAEHLQSLKELGAASDGEYERVAEMVGIDVGEQRKRSRKGRSTAVGILVVFIGVGLAAYIYRGGFTNHPDTSIAAMKDIPPGGNKATLTLGNGQVITLSDARNGLVTQQGNAKVLKVDGGEISYTSAKSKGQDIVYNTITTPITGEFKVVLSDGTQVFLNSSSSLKYPSVFAGATREVTLTGEAYFEVARNKSVPFIVKTANATSVKVLGTHFDIMAYSDEPDIKTTLLEGSVLVAYGDNSGLLNPGDQASVSQSGSVKVMQGVDVDEAVAWKNGLFQFDHADLQSILRQVSRWYGVEVVYKGNIPTESIKGEAPRNVNLSKLLQGLTEMTGVQFQMDGNKLMVSHP